MKNKHFFSPVYTAIIIATLISCDPPSNDHSRSVPSSTCTISTTAEDYFKYDAAELAVEQLFAENSADTNLVLIPNDYYNAYIKALGMIYDATSIPQRDSVIDMHLFCQWNRTHSILFSTSGIPTWVDNWMNNIIPTGNAAVDSAITNYNLSITEGAFGGPMPWYIVESNHPINGVALAYIFETFPGVTQAEPNTYYSFYSNLAGSFSGNTTHIVFYQGWGDCPAGCFGYHQWKFDVDVDLCTVTFTGYYP
jgi:hypothetical protein